MKHIIRALFAMAVAAFAVPAIGQTFLQNLPANTAVGRLGAGTSGPAQAIPFTSLATALQPYLSGLAPPGTSGQIIIGQPGGAVALWKTPSGDVTSITPAGVVTLGKVNGVPFPSSYTANAPLIGNGTGIIGTGTRSGNTTVFATTNGALNNGNCVGIDASGNLVDEGGPCTTGGGGGTVVAGTAGQYGCYLASAATLSGCSTPGTSAILMSNGTGGFADSTMSMVTPGGTTGSYLQIPALNATGGGSALILSTSTYAQSGHEFIACFLCDISQAAGGSTIFAGSDGTGHSIIGNPIGAIGDNVHMTGLGSSIDCEATEAICIGHGATVKGEFSIVMGQATSVSGSNVVIGRGNAQTSALSAYNVIIGIGAGTISSSGQYNILIATLNCTIAGTIGEGIGIGRDACPSATGHVVIGGAQATALYAGTESSFVPVFSGGTYMSGTAPNITTFGTCKGNAGSWVGGALGGIFTSNGTCTTGQSYQFVFNLSLAPPNGVNCLFIDHTTPAVTLHQTSINNPAGVTFEVTSATGVANTDTISMTCQGY